VYIGAHPEWIEELARNGCLAPGSRREIGGNSLVIVARTDGPSSVPSLPDRIAVADPSHVPLGRYTREALRSDGRWSRWRPRLLPGLDARAAVEYVRRGEASVGIVYRTDAVAWGDLRILEEIDPASHAPVRLEAALVEGADEAAERFLDDLCAPEAREILVQRGFTLPAETER